jgi:hypothetical protein
MLLSLTAISVLNLPKLGPVNTYFAARDGDGFHPVRGTSHAAEQASVSGEQRRAGRDRSCPSGLRGKNAGAK